MPYDSLLFLSNIERLHQSWQIQERHSLTEFAKKQAALNHLLPDKLEPNVISKMRHPTWYPVLYNRTNRYHFFIHYAFSHYQTQ